MAKLRAGVGVRLEVRVWGRIGKLRELADEDAQLESGKGYALV